MESGGAPRLSVNFGSEVSLHSSLFPTADNVPVLAGSESQISDAALRNERKVVDDMRAATAMVRERRSRDALPAAPRGEIFVPVPRQLPTIELTAPQTPQRQSVLEALRESAEAVQRGSARAAAMLDREPKGEHVAIDPMTIGFGSGHGMARLYRE